MRSNYPGYEMTLFDGNEEVKVTLRLPILAQINLKKKYPKEATDETGRASAMGVILAAMSNEEITVGIFDEALNYKGNTNTIKSGADLYDLLVDNGYRGLESFVPVIANLAYESGIISAKFKEAIEKQAQGVDAIYEEAEEGTAKNA